MNRTATRGRVEWGLGELTVRQVSGGVVVVGVVVVVFDRAI